METGKSKARRSDSLRTQIHLDIVERIRSGEIGPDDRLVDIEVAQNFGVSRMPAREALLQLVNEGYIVGTTRGFVLPRLSREDVADIFEIRRLLEPRAAANAARDMTDEGIEELRLALAQAEASLAAGDVSGFSQANASFRRAWISQIRNQRFAETLSRFADQVNIVRSGTLSKPETQKIVVSGLRDLFRTFKKRDPLGAHDLMVSFVANAEAAFFATFEANAEASAAPGRGAAPRQGARS